MKKKMFITLGPGVTNILLIFLQYECCHVNGTRLKELGEAKVTCARGPSFQRVNTCMYGSE